MPDGLAEPLYRPDCDCGRCVVARRAVLAWLREHPQPFASAGQAVHAAARHDGPEVVSWRAGQPELARCAVCRQAWRITVAGRLPHHGPRGRGCAGSGRRVHVRPGSAAPPKGPGRPAAVMDDV